MSGIHSSLSLGREGEMGYVTAFSFGLFGSPPESALWKNNVSTNRAESEMNAIEHHVFMYLLSCGQPVWGEKNTSTQNPCLMLALGSRGMLQGPAALHPGAFVRDVESHTSPRSTESEFAY